MRILAAVQAIISGLVAVVIFARFGFAVTDPNAVNASFAAGILGTLGLVYYLTLHQVFSRYRLALSTLILTIITALNIILVVASTGGLDSPYYSLWLLAIVVAGIFGRYETISVLAITLIYYAYALFSKGISTAYFEDHMIQLGITLLAAALAEWVHTRNRKATAANTRLASLSGQLSAEQLKAEAIMSSIGEGVMVVDTGRKVQLFNKAAQELSGWDESSAQNIDLDLVLQLKTAEDQPVAQGADPFSEAWKTGKTVVNDNLFMTTRAGRKVQLAITVSPVFDDKQQPNGAIALFRDVSKEKEVEREKEEFVSTASHEMRTPVAAIEGYLSLAMNPNVATIDERAKKYLDKAHEAIQHLGDLFKDLLSVTKAEEGKLESGREAVNLAKLLQGATDDMQVLARKKNLTLVYQIGGGTGKAIAPLYYVAANPERLREVVMNLIDNGIKFTAQGGLKVVLEGNDKEVIVSVSDTGLGIAAEDIPHLFQKFYRIDSTDTRTIGGTGLGLYLCRRVIELFNGRIWIESKLGEGSTFKFSLPRLSQDEVSRMEAAAASANSGPGTSQATAGAVVQPTPDAPPADAPMPVPTPLVAEPVPGQDDGSAAPQASPAPATPAHDAVSIPLRRRVQ
ncbi:MAG: two-component sensor kinase, involved in phosphate sensing [Candidatus Saccharibacteria bacterium]|jgi:PAS domain S-box-containing protein|nr:two-component sensor kinase, involved in phosphate sensing [Candidatus Saccharibacteria bacterium]